MTPWPQIKTARELAAYAGCWLAFQIFMLLPWPAVCGRFGLWLIGFAGRYAHSDGFADFAARRLSP